MSIDHNGLPSRIRGWFDRLTRIQKLLAATAALIITIGGVASAITAVLDLADRLGNDSSAGAGNSVTDTGSSSAGAGGSKVYLGVEVEDIVRQSVVTRHERNTKPEEPTPSSPGEDVIKPPPEEAHRIAGDRSLEGVRVVVVYRDSPASRAGVRPGDIITAINGTRVEDVDDFMGILITAQPGDYLWLSVIRDSHKLSIRGIKLESLAFEGATMPDRTVHD